MEDSSKILIGRRRPAAISAKTLRRLIRFMRTKPLGATGLMILLLGVVVALAAPILAPYDPWRLDSKTILISPNSTYWFGTDLFGRDILSRTIYGARISILVGMVTMVVASTIGVITGVTSAYLGGWYDLIVQRVVDAMSAFPSLLLALAIMAAFGTSLRSVLLALVIIFSGRGVRVIRSQAMTIKSTPYIDSAIAIGAGNFRIMLRHVLPNTFGATMVVATTMIGSAIALEASLSFLGVGMPVTVISWGGMLSGEVLGNFASAPWIGIFPGLVLTLVVFGVNVYGDALRDMLDPRLRGR